MQQKWQQVSDAARAANGQTVELALMATLSKAVNQEYGAFLQALFVEDQTVVAADIVITEDQSTGVVAAMVVRPCEGQPAIAAEVVRGGQPATADELSAAAEIQLAVGRAIRRRHRVRRRANGAPRSCALENGRWINLPRARQRVPLMVASVSKCYRTRCKFNDSLKGCQRSNCKYPPAGHAPELDGQDVLDPMVELELDKLRARVSVLEMQMRHS